MRIDLLYTPSCPHHAGTLELIHEVLREVGIQAAVASVAVASEDEAQRLRFVGSPTVRVNDLDLEPNATFAARDFGLRCRAYAGDGKVTDIPSRRALRDAIEMGFLAEMDLLGTCC